MHSREETRPYEETGGIVGDVTYKTTFIPSLNILSYDDNDRETHELGDALLIYVAQETACCVHYVCDGNFRK